MPMTIPPSPTKAVCGPHTTLNSCTVWMDRSFSETRCPSWATGCNIFRHSSALTAWSKPWQSLHTTTTSENRTGWHTNLWRNNQANTTVEEWHTRLEQVMEFTQSLEALGPTKDWKVLGPTLHGKLHELFVCCWTRAAYHWIFLMQSPSPFMRTRKKSPTLQLLGITLLSITGKILAMGPLNRVGPAIAAGHPRKSQWWFQSQQEHYRHGIHSQAAPGERSGDCM